MKKGLFLLFTLFIVSTLPSCTTRTEGTAETTQSKEIQKMDQEAPEGGTPVIMMMNGREVHATLNDTLTAREFIQLLPYSVTVSRATDDLCGSVREELASDPSEGLNRWKIGEIGWFGGWFTILVDNEERFSKMPGVMIIGSIDEEDIDYVTQLSGRVDIEVSLAE